MGGRCESPSPKLRPGKLDREGTCRRHSATSAVREHGTQALMGRAFTPPILRVRTLFNCPGEERKILLRNLKALVPPSLRAQRAAPRFPVNTDRFEVARLAPEGLKGNLVPIGVRRQLHLERDDESGLAACWAHQPPCVRHGYSFHLHTLNPTMVEPFNDEARTFPQEPQAPGAVSRLLFGCRVISMRRLVGDYASSFC